MIYCSAPNTLACARLGRVHIHSQHTRHKAYVVRVAQGRQPVKQQRSSVASKSALPFTRLAHCLLTVSLSKTCVCEGGEGREQAVPLCLKLKHDGFGTLRVARSAPIGRGGGGVNDTDLAIAEAQIKHDGLGAGEAAPGHGHVTKCATSASKTATLQTAGATTVWRKQQRLGPLCV